MNDNILKGDIYFADLNPIIGDEQGGVRPVLIIQNDIGNYFSNTVIVAIITSRSKVKLPTHHKISARNGLLKDSIVMTEQIRTIDKKRLQSKIGHLGYVEQLKVDRCLIKSLCIKNRAFINDSD